MNIFKRLIEKGGFTLAEALVVTILVGYIMVPIIGSLQHGMVQTENFDHREKLRNLARSRLNREVSAGAFDLRAIDSRPGYHYVAYNTATEPRLFSFDAWVASDTDLASFPASVSSILYSYKTEVEIKENLPVESENGVATFSKPLKGLKALVVKSELEYNDNVTATDSVSLFAMLNIPSFSEDFIWVCNPGYLEVYALDPISRTVTETFYFPRKDPSKPVDDDAQNDVRPVHLAVHPNRKFIIAQAKKRILALNINRNSSSYGQVAALKKEEYEIVECNKDNNKDKAMKDRGVVFRPDGKMVFLTYHHLKTVRAYQVVDADSWPPVLGATASGSLDLSHVSLDSDKYSSFVAGNDGWLYLAVQDKKAAIRFPMFAQLNGGELPFQIVRDTWIDGNVASAKEKEAWSIRPSNDGNTFFILWKDSYISRFKSSDLSIIGRAKVNCGGVVNDFLLSGNEKNWAFTNDIDNAANSGIYFMANNYIDLLNLNTTATINTTSCAFPGKTKTAMLCLSPKTDEFVADPEELPEIYLIDQASAMANSYTKSNGELPLDRKVNIATYNKAHVSFTARQPQVLAVACSNPEKIIKFIDINTGDFIENRQITLAANTKFLAFNQNGSSITTVYDDGCFHRWDTTTLSSTFYHIYANVEKIVNIATDSLQDNFATMEIHASDNGFNGYWAPTLQADETITSSDPRWPKDSNNNWRAGTWTAKDIVAFRDQGFLVLLRDGSDNCALDWVKKEEWGPQKDKFIVVARWRTVTDQFPPQKAYAMAISPDGGFLAIATDHNPNRIHLYDLRANDFGHWTQLFGLVADYRVCDNNADCNFVGQIADNCSFKVSSPTLDNGINLASCTTSFDTWRSHRDFPGNYLYLPNGETNNGIAGNDDRNKATKTFFGYFIPPVDIAEFAVAHWDPTRVFLNNQLKFESTDCAADSSHEFAGAPTAFSLNNLQINHKTNGNERLVGLFTAINNSLTPAAPTGVNTGTGSFDDNYNEVASYDKIASTSTRPFQFTPVHLCSYEVTGCNNDVSGMAFSRNAANPVLFYFDAVDDEIVAIKPGFPPTNIDVGSIDFLNRQLTTSVDGQTLIFAKESSSYEVYMVDISNPDSTADNFSFDGGTYDWNSMTGFGRRIKTVSLTSRPTALATLPMNYHDSSAPNGTYVSIATMTDAIFGCGNAAIASGGIYIMGGSPSFSSVAPTTNVLLFQPHLTGGLNIASVTTNVLKKPVCLHSTAAYDNKIYVFGGSDGTAPTSWVQCYNLATGKVISSFDPTSSGALVSLQVNATMTDYTAPSPVEITDSGNIYNSGAPLWISYPGWQAMDGVTSLGWAATTNCWFTYDAGDPSLAFVVNRIWVNNSMSDPNGGVNDYNLYGFDGINWHNIESGTVPEDSTSYNHSFTNSTAYQKYKFEITSRHGEASYYGLREVRFFLDNVRRVSPILSDYTNGTVTVSADSDKDDPAWRAFDDNLTNGGEWDTGSSSFPHWIKLDLGAADIVDILRIYNGPDDGIKDFVFQGSNDDVNFTDLNLFNGSSKITCFANKGFYTYYFNNFAGYRYYRVYVTTAHGPDDTLEPWEIQFYSTRPTPPPSEPIMTKMLNDVRSPLALQQGAACTTPFGIMVAGGVYAASQATSTATIYWPHAIDYYNSSTDMSYGISRSLPLLPQATANHCLVWHKGKVYRVGGNGTGDATGALDNINIFDFSTNSWATMTSNTGGFDTAFDFTKRNAAAACSFGDEIFIFGGLDEAGKRRIDGAAWNPTTNQVRKLGDLPKTSGSNGTFYHTVCMSAVPYGSFIYLIGGAGISTDVSTDAASTAEKNSVGKEIIKFSP